MIRYLRMRWAAGGAVLRILNSRADKLTKVYTTHAFTERERSILGGAQ